MAVFGLIFISTVLFVYTLSSFKKRYLVSLFICGLYLFSCIIGIMIALDKSNRVDFTLWPCIVFLLVFNLYLIPFMKKIPVIGGVNKKCINRFIFIGYGISAVLLIGDVLLASKIQEVALVGFAEARVMGYNDDPTLTSFTTSQHIGHSILRWFSGLSYLLVVMFFYSMVFIRKHTLFKIILIISSLSAGYYGLCGASRTRLMYWFLFFFMSYLIFGEYLTKKGKIAIRTAIIIFASIVVSAFVLISIVRSELQGLEMDDFLTSYAGQPIVNFCTFIDGYEPPSYSVYRILPLSSTLVSGRFDLVKYRDYVYAKTGFEINGFNTMMGDFYIDTGLMGMFLVSFVFFLVAYRLMKEKTFGFNHLCLLTILLQIPLFGVFYYSLWQMESSVCSIMTLLFGAFIMAPNKK